MAETELNRSFDDVVNDLDNDDKHIKELSITAQQISEIEQEEDTINDLYIDYDS